MSYLLRVYRKNFLESNGLDNKLIDVTLKTDLNRLQDYLDAHKCLNYYEAEEMLLDYWLLSENKEESKKYIAVRGIMRKACLDTKKIMNFWKNRKR